MSDKAQAIAVAYMLYVYFFHASTLALSCSLLYHVIQVYRLVVVSIALIKKIISDVSIQKTANQVL